VNHSTIDAVIDILNFQVGSFPFTYLGVKISPRKLRASDCNDLLVKTNKKLAHWKRDLLSQAGRLVLIKSTLSAIPTYWLSNCTIPLGMVDQLTKIMRSFLWEKSDCTKGLHLISWGKVTNATNAGGLGIRDLRTLQPALLAPKAWNLIRIEIFKNQYATFHPWRSGKKKKKSPLYKAIHNSMESMKDGLIKQLGDGKSTSILDDPWVFEIPIAIKPTLINMDLQFGNRKVSWLLSKGSWRCNRLLELFGESLAMAIFSLPIPVAKTHDDWIWMHQPNGQPSVKSIYEFIHRDPQNTKTCWPGWTKIWKLKVAPRIKTFLWKLVWGKLPTKDRLWYIFPQL